MSKNRGKRIIFSGGGTAGSVSPLLAIAEEILDPPLSPLKTRGETKYDFLWVGTKTGPEKEMVSKVGIDFKSISSGKLRRYFSWQNLVDPFRIIAGFFQSIAIILKFKPDLAMSAGGFVSVPLVWAAWLLSVPVLIHQQDVRPGLANKLMAPFADKITVTFEKSLKDYGKKAVWVGNPVRQSLTDNRQQTTGSRFKFQDDKPVVLVVGGGTGAKFLNQITLDSAEELSQFCNAILIAGKNKSGSNALKAVEPLASFKTFEFLNVDEMAEVLNMATVVVSRAGLGLCTELSYLEKPTIFIPIPDSHQEDNAKIFQEKDAAIVLDQNKLDRNDFIENIKKLVTDENLQKKYSEDIGKVIKKGANIEIVKIINNII